MYMTLYMYMYIHVYLYPERVEGVRVRREGVGGWGVVSERWGQWQWWSSHAVLPALLLPPLPTEFPAAAAHTHTHTHTVVILNQTHVHYIETTMWVEETLQGFIDMNRSTTCVHEMQNTQQSERGVPTVFPS